MRIRSFLLALASLALFSATAVAQESVPLTKDKGENIAPVARVPFPGANEVEMAGDWAFVSVDKGPAGGADGGLVIVNIADPTHPYVQGTWYGNEDSKLPDVRPGDVDLTTDGNLAVLTNAHCSSCTYSDFLIDTTDKSAPKLVGKIKYDSTMDSPPTRTSRSSTSPIRRIRSRRDRSRR
jgi:hypothetical protein